MAVAPGGKLTGAELRERLAPSHQDEVRRGEAALARAEQFAASQEGRPLADKCYLQELAEDDGRFLTQVLERLGDEVQALTLRGVNREIALCLTKIQEAHHWAVEHGRKNGSHVIIDRRIFRTDRSNSDG